MHARSLWLKCLNPWLIATFLCVLSARGVTTNELERFGSEDSPLARIYKLNYNFQRLQNLENLIGSRGLTNSGSVLFGDGTVSEDIDNEPSFAFGVSVSSTGGGGSLAQGAGAQASGYSASAQGVKASASAYASHASGYEAIASGFASVAMGDHATASNNNSFVFSDGTGSAASTASNQFTISAQNGLRLLKGTFQGNGGGLTNVTGTVGLTTNLVVGIVTLSFSNGLLIGVSP